MILRNINFGSVHGASGVTGFFSGNEYYYHKIYNTLIESFDFNEMTKVAKTVTAFARRGNTELAKDGYSIKRFNPESIYALPFQNTILNAVGLSNPGIDFLLAKNIWQQWTKPFFLSVMAVGTTKKERLAEISHIVEKLSMSHFKAPYGIQVNFSCPNTEHGQDELLDEILEVLEILAKLDVPLVPKFNLLLRPEKVFEIMQNPNCDAVCTTNTIPYGELRKDIPWEKLFGNKSPLEKYNGGGLSGKYLFPLLIQWLHEAKKVGMTKPIIACGGISSKEDIYKIWSNFHFVKAVSIGSVAITRPWRIKGMIEYGNQKFKRETFIR